MKSLKNTKANQKSIRNFIGTIRKEQRLSSCDQLAIADINIDILDNRETVKLVDQYIQTHTPLHLMGVNADKINSAQKNPLLAEIINSCGIINADGASVVLASKYLKKTLPERVAGIDLMLELVKLSSEKKYKVFLLGAKQNVVNATKQELQKQYPNLNICGLHDGYFNKSKWSTISNIIKTTKPDIVFVGITSPTKEYLIEYLQNQGHSAVFMGVGGSFDVISKEIKRAPKWMQSANLEWLYRVYQEPKRLFKRYFIGNTVFINTIRKEKSKQHKGKEK